MPQVSLYDPQMVRPERRPTPQSGRVLSPQEILALEMIQRGTSNAPVHSPLQGLARALQAPIGAYVGKQGREKREGQQAEMDTNTQRALAEALALSQGQPGAPPTSGGPPMSPRAPDPRAAQQRAMRDPQLAPKMADQVLAQIMAGPQQQKPYTLSPGAQRRGPNNQLLAENPAVAKPPTGHKLVKDGSSETGYSYVNAQGNKIPNAPPPRGGMNLQFGDEGRLQSLSTGGAQVQGGLGKSTRTDLEKGVLSDQAVVDRLTYIDSLYDPNFLTYKGAVTGFGADIWNKLDPDQRSKFTQRRSAFASQVHNFSNAYRKWVTGVASSAKELPLIENAIPNMKDSPQSFESKKDNLKQFTRKLMVRKIAALNDGITIGSDRWKEYMDENPMEGIPSLQERGEELEAMDYPKEQIKNILRQEGYMGL